MALVEVTPPKLVEVSVGGSWHAGELRAWRRDRGVWRGYVTYSVGVGLRHVGWIDQHQLRPCLIRGEVTHPGRAKDTSPGSGKDAVGEGLPDKPAYALMTRFRDQPIVDGDPRATGVCCRACGLSGWS
jgi:hypothetical protein